MSRFTKVTILAAVLSLASVPFALAEDGTTLGGSAKDNSASGGSEASGTSKAGSGAMTKKSSGTMMKKSGAMSGEAGK